MRARSLLFLAASASAAVAGCAAPPSGDDGEAAVASPVVGGTSAPYERPEIGRFHDCTGTLVSTDVVLSAAHCFDFTSGERALGDFVVERRDGPRAFPAVEVRVFGDATGQDDLALVRLARAVPGDVATPRAIADVRPPRGAPVTMWGYGCTSRPERVIPTGGGVITSGEATDKRKVGFGWDTDTRSACPGDSGGPLLDERAAIVAVVSAYVSLPVEEGGGLDVFADPVRRAAELRAQIARWSR